MKKFILLFLIFLSLNFFYCGSEGLEGDQGYQDSDAYGDLTDRADCGDSGGSEVGDTEINEDADLLDASLEDVEPHRCSYKEVVFGRDLSMDISVDLKDYRASKYYIEEEISVTADQDGDTITLFGNGHTLSYVSGEYQYDGSRITICLKPYKKGDRISARLGFTVNSKDDLFGLRRWRLNYLESVIGPFTEPYYSYYWLFVPQSGYDISQEYDYNVVLNSVSLTIKTPDNSWKAYSIGGAKGVSDNIYHFEFNTPIPLYSLSFAVSNNYNEFDSGTSKSGVNIKGIALKSNLPKAKKAFSSAATTIDRMEEIVGSYDFGGLLQIADIPEFGGGMEHTTIIWIGSDVINSQGIEAQYVTAHEVIHHWWGDNLIFYDWPHFWLAEGFTEWSTIYEILPLITDEKTAKKIKYNWRSYAAEEYSTNGVPLRFADSDDMMSYFDGVLDQFYKYGSSAVEMILLRLERDFKKDRYDFLKSWFNKYRHTAATTEDLRQFLIDYTSDYKFWEEFFNEWVYSTPCPTLKIYDYNFDGSSVSFKIKKTLGIQKMRDIDIHIFTNQGRSDTTVSLENINEEKTVSLNISDSPYHIAIDPNYYYVFVLDRSEWKGPYADFSDENFSSNLVPIRPDIYKPLYSRWYKRYK